MKSFVVPFALLELSSPASAQDFHRSLQPVADYSQCVAERARALRPAPNAVEEAIASAMTKCKGQRSRALSATRARMKAVGLPADTKKQSGNTMFASMESSMKETLRRELASTHHVQPNGGAIDGSQRPK